jgi:hypothetical protein
MCSAVHVEWVFIILTITFKYIQNIKNCRTLSDFGCVEIYIEYKSLLVYMEIELYCILHLKGVEFPCHKFSTFSSFAVVHIACNLDYRYLGISFSHVQYIDITDGDCGCGQKRPKHVAINIR